MWLKRPWASENVELKKIFPITMEMWGREVWMQIGMSLLLFIHYFHNDCHYVRALIEFHFVSQVWGERNNYHLSDIKIHAEHFHGQSLHMFGKEERLVFDYKRKETVCLSCRNDFRLIPTGTNHSEYCWALLSCVWSVFASRSRNITQITQHAKSECSHHAV